MPHAAAVLARFAPLALCQLVAWLSAGLRCRVRVLTPAACADTRLRFTGDFRASTRPGLQLYVGQPVRLKAGGAARTPFKLHDALGVQCVR